MTVMSLDDLLMLPPITDEETKIIENAKPTPSDDCPEMTDSELSQFRPWYDRERKQIKLEIDVGIISYFKRLSAETSVSYQELIRMFLAQCVREKKKPSFI